MCGIIGYCNFPEQKKLVEEGLHVMQNRGADNTSIAESGAACFGHNLHAIVGYVKQPIENEKGILVTNCEIYNWRELNAKYSLSATNDAEMLFLLFQRYGLAKIHHAVQELDGDFACAYLDKKTKKIVLARDIAGVKPLVYYFDKKSGALAFASEKKALPFDSVHLNPRQIVTIDCAKKSLHIASSEIPTVATKKSQALFTIGNHLYDAIMNRVPQKDFGVLLSGGLDSTLIAKILLDSGRTFSGVISYVAGMQEPKDLPFARNVATALQLKLIEAPVTLAEYEKELPRIISLIESSDPVRVGVASVVYFATKKLFETEPTTKVLFSGLGADELFAGYDRFNKSMNVNKDCYSYFIKLYENDLYFQDIVCMYHKLELRVPFLDKNLVSSALTLDPMLKIDAKTKENKKILREFALSINIPATIALRPKRAAQYGSNFDKAIEVLAKKYKFKSKAAYLSSLVSLDSKKNIPLAALLSTGKDSLFALHLMQKQGYPIKCLITVKSKNPDSFMFHTPTIALAKLQAQALGIPLITVTTSGKKEEEVQDLLKAVTAARNTYGIEGVISGALYSNYQRERIERICETVGVRSFAPLWQIAQLEYLKQLCAEGFEVIITKIAAQGLDASWLGRNIDAKAINELALLQKRYGIHPAGEGGEYESLVLNAPLFKKKIAVTFKKKLQNDCTGELSISSAKLVKK